MLYGSIPQVKKPVSRIVFGTSYPKMFAAFRSVYGEAPDFNDRLNAAFELLDGVYAQGVNCFDCADHYGEEPLGEWLEARGLHDQVVILTKGAHHNRWRKRVTDFDILHDVHNSLAKLKTNRLDMYLLHRDDPQVPVEPIMDVLNRCYDEGKIGVFGVSNWEVARIEQANNYAERCGLQPFKLTSPNFGLAEQVNDPWGGGCTSIAGPSKRADRAYFAQHGMPVFAYSALGRGFFSGRLHADHPEAAPDILEAAAVKGYCCPDNFERLRRCEILAQEKQMSVAQIALAWIFNQKDVDVYALVSCGVQNMEKNIIASQTLLTPAECGWLNLENER